MEAGGTPPTFQRGCLAPLSLLALLLSCYLLSAGEEGPAVGCPACWLLGCLGAGLAALANPVSGTPSPTATTTSIVPVTPPNTCHVPQLPYPPKHPLPQCLPLMRHMCSRHLSHIRLMQNPLSINPTQYTVDESVASRFFPLNLADASSMHQLSISHMVDIALKQYCHLTPFQLPYTPLKYQTPSIALSPMTPTWCFT